MPRLGVSRVLPYPREQLFDLAADVERYPEFLPWWQSARVRRRDGDIYYTEQVIGFGPIRRRFSTKTVLRRPEAIEVTSADGQFETFQLIWRFALLAEGRTTVALTGELEMRGPLLRDLFGQMAAGSAGSILSAFEERARRLLGPPPR
jgi:coenzyme Q-binding protein COQ10